MLQSSGHAPDAVARVGEDEEEGAADDADHQREGLHDLVHLLGVLREEAVGDSVVRQRDGREHHHCHQRVHQVDEPHPVPLLLGHLHPEAGLEHGEAARRDEAVVELPVGGAEAVGEVEEEAGERAEAEEELDHARAHRGARSVARGRGKEELECEEGAGGEEIDQHRGLGEGLLHALRHGPPLPAAFASGVRWRRRGARGAGAGVGFDGALHGLLNGEYWKTWGLYI